MISSADRYLSFAKSLAFTAGDLMLASFRMSAAVSAKSDKTLVTATDKKINQMVIDQVAKNFPDHAVFGEEAASKNKSEFVWVCDPLDGTTQYSKGIPIATFSLALAQRGKPVIGVIYDPFLKRLYTAAIGRGASLNNRPVHVSKRRLDFYATIDVEWWPEADWDIDTASHLLSAKSKAYMMKLGATVNGCSLVAAGQYEACIFSGSKGKSVDIAAAKVIVDEAGGKVTDLFGHDQRYDGDIKGAIVSNGLVHPALVKALRSALSIRSSYEPQSGPYSAPCKDSPCK